MMIYPMFNYLMFSPLFVPTDDRPPTIYELLDSIVNYGKEETKIRDLANAGRSVIFNFNYPLSTKINKQDFECMILNHYMQRRIGFQTFNAFQLQLNVKLNEIMPLYNKMFDAIENWDIFNDGEITNRYGEENRTNETTNTLTNKSNTLNDKKSDRRYSDLPQNQLNDLQDGNYVTEHNYDIESNSSQDNSTSNGNSNTNDDNKYNETIKKSPADKISILKELQENVKNIYTLIFKDLDCLFFSLL